jgi:alpha-D-ribose 1-methylphosphonate 5-triphosphate synthase subunit PhnH
MNDDLEILVRESLDRLTAEPADPADLVGQARRRVARRRHSVRAAAALGAAAIAAVAALAVTSTLPSTGQHTHARLAAWTVARHADGHIYLTIRLLRDPAGLQRALRADGVQANVTFAIHQDSACQPVARQAAPWTVAKQADGTITVTLAALRDPAGLQRALRADGVRANITFASHHPAPCKALKASPKRTSS